MFPRPSLMLSLVFVVAFPLSTTAKSAMLLVGPGQPFTTIQAAVDASKDGDTIKVTAGIYNESVVIRGKNKLTLLGLSAESVHVIGNGGHAIQITSGDGLATPRPPDDVQARPVGTGVAYVTCLSPGSNLTIETAPAGDDTTDAIAQTVTTGPNGICETTATGDDFQSIPVGQGTPGSSCVGSGSNGVLQTTASGDDATTSSAISSGPDGVCNTTAATGDDVFQLDQGLITSGGNGICDTTATGGDTQTIPVGQGDPDTNCVIAGFDDVLDTASTSGDDVIDAPNKRITSGPNGVCETTAAVGDLQVLAVGQGKAGGGCVTAGAPLKRSRYVKVGNLSLRAPDGFDGVNVDRSDFVSLEGLRMDGKLDLADTDPATGRNGIFVDFTAVKPTVKSCRAKRIPPRSSGEILFNAAPHAGYFIEGPSAVVTSCTAESNEIGFAQFQSSDSALYTGNTAVGNGTGFAIAGQVNILQRCVALSNTIGFDVLGVGNILFQVLADTNGVGIQSIGRGTRIRSSTIQNSTDVGIRLMTDPDDATIDAQGSEVFASFIQNNTNAGVEDDVFGVFIHSSTIGPLGTGAQNVGVHLMSNSGGTLLESNRIVGNKDAGGSVCGANQICDLKNEGQHNAGRLNQFSPGFTVPDEFK